MKATSVQVIKNVKDICFSIENDPIEMESKLTIVASTNDDIFAFEFEGSDLLQSCKKAGLFTGWENDETIKRKNREINELNQKLYQSMKDKERLTDKYNLMKAANEKIKENAAKIEKENKQNKELADIWSRKYYNLSKKFDKLKEENEKLKQLKTATIENFADEEPSSRRDILRCAEKCVCGHREQDYGSPESNFQLIADLWDGYLGEKTDNPVISVTPVDVSMMMALMKIARIRNGGGSGDSFVDLAGYAACGGEIWAGQKHQKDLN